MLKEDTVEKYELGFVNLHTVWKYRKLQISCFSVFDPVLLESTSITAKF